MADTRGIRAGRAFIELGVSDRLTAGLRRAQKQLEAFGAGLRSAGIRLAGIGAAAVTAFVGAARHFARVGDDLEEMSQRTGVSVEALSELGFAAEIAGADLETLETGLKHMQRSIVEAAGGSESAQRALAMLGLTAADLAGLAPDEQFARLADRIALVEDPAQRVALAMQLLGRSGTRLLPLLAEGALGIEALRERARRLGLTISAETAHDAAELNDALDSLWRVLRQGVFAIGAALAPTLKELAERITRVIVAATGWIKRNRDLVVIAARVALGVVAVGSALIVLGLLLSLVGSALGGLAAIVSGVGAAFGLIGSALGALLSPIGLVVIAAAGLGVALLRSSGAGAAALDFLAERFGTLRGVAGRTLQGMSDALAAGDIPLAARVLWAGLRLLWREGTADLSRAWIEARAFFVSTAQAMFFGAVAAAQIGFHALEVAWIETTAFLSKTWTRFTSGFQRIWNTAVAFVAKRMLEIQGLFDRSLDVEAAKSQVDEDLARRLAEIDEEARRALEQREERRALQRRRTSELNEATLAEIGRRFEEAQRALEDATGARIEDAKRALEDARRELDTALDEARRKREAAEAEDAAKPTFGDRFRDLEDRLSSLGEGIGRRNEVRGTFNGLAAQGLATSGGTAERTAKAAEQTARNTKRLVEAAQSGGLTFA